MRAGCAVEVVMPAIRWFLAKKVLTNESQWISNFPMPMTARAAIGSMCLFWQGALHSNRRADAGEGSIRRVRYLLPWRCCCLLPEWPGSDVCACRIEGARRRKVPFHDALYIPLVTFRGRGVDAFTPTPLRARRACLVHLAL